jgi:hypothetical protein
VDVIDTVTEPTVVHETPSADRDAVIVLPDRTSRTQVGVKAAAVPLTEVDVPPVETREIICGPFEALVVIATCFALAASDSRISTPTFDEALVFWFCVTRATIDPLPVSVW